VLRTRAAALLLPGARRCRSISFERTALSSKCGQRHVDASEQPEQPDRDETVQMSNTSGSGSEWITLAELGTELHRPLRDRTTWTYFEGSRTKLLLSIFRHFSRVTLKKPRKKSRVSFWPRCSDRIATLPISARIQMSCVSTITSRYRQC